PYGLTAADLNGDGNLDLAATEALSKKVAVLLSDTVTGDFGPHVDYSVGVRPYGVTSADFDGDGHPDLAVVNQTDRTVSVLVSDTTKGDLAAHVDYSVGSSPTSLPSNVAAADFNGDGEPDLAVNNNGTNNISVLLNRTSVTSLTS